MLNHRPVCGIGDRCMLASNHFLKRIAYRIGDRGMFAREHYLKQVAYRIGDMGMGMFACNYNMYL